MRVEHMYSLYPYVQLLVIELDSYALMEAMEFNTGKVFCYYYIHQIWNCILNLSFFECLLHV